MHTSSSIPVTVEWEGDRNRKSKTTCRITPSQPTLNWWSWMVEEPSEGAMPSKGKFEAVKHRAPDPKLQEEVLEEVGLSRTAANVEYAVGKAMKDERWWWSLGQYPLAPHHSPVIQSFSVNSSIWIILSSRIHPFLLPIHIFIPYHFLYLFPFFFIFLVRARSQKKFSGVEDQRWRLIEKWPN